MSKVSKHPSDASDQNKLGPDYFRYFTRVIKDMLSEDQEDILPSRLPNSKPSGPEVFSPFGDSIGPDLSDLKKERLKALLRQSAVTLSKEVNEFLEPALSIQHLRSLLRSKTNAMNVNEVSTNDVEEAPFKEHKSSPTSSCPSAPEDCANLGSSRVVDSELQLFLENNSMEVEEIVTNFAKDISGTLSHMEQQLEKILDTVMSKCRPMSIKEKQQLRKMIQKLPPKNLIRVSEIIQHKRTEETDSSDEIIVDLDKENNVTLWRLYYYVEAVKKAKKLASG